MQHEPEALALIERARPFLQNLKIISTSVVHSEAYQKRHGKSIWQAINEVESAIHYLTELSSGMREQINTGPSRIGEIIHPNPANPSNK